MGLARQRRPTRQPKAELAPEDMMQGPDGKVRSVQAERELNTSFVKTFATPDGERVLNYLTSITINEVAGPDVQTNPLLHKEGQRFIVGLVKRRLSLGKEGK